MFVFCVRTEGCGVSILLGGKDFAAAAPHSVHDPAGRSRPLLSSVCMSRLRSQEKQVKCSKEDTLFSAPCLPAALISGAQDK